MTLDVLWMWQGRGEGVGWNFKEIYSWWFQPSGECIWVCYWHGLVWSNMGYANAHTFQRSIHSMLACNWRLFQEPPRLEHEAYWCPAPFLLLLVSGTHNLRLYWCWKKRSIFFPCLHNFPFKVANDVTLVLFSTTIFFCWCKCERTD